MSTSSANDNLLWLIVGDIPPMYLGVNTTDMTIQLLEDYTELAQDWINQIKAGKSIENCYPFKADPTIEMADLLQLKVNQIKDSLIRNIDEIGLKLPVKLNLRKKYPF